MNQINSYDLYKLINNAREVNDKVAIRHNAFIDRIKRECPEIRNYYTSSRKQSNNNGVNYFKCCELDTFQAIAVCMREDFEIRTELLNWFKSKSVTKDPKSIELEALKDRLKILEEENKVNLEKQEELLSAIHCIEQSISLINEAKSYLSNH